MGELSLEHQLPFFKQACAQPVNVSCYLLRAPSDFMVQLLQLGLGWFGMFGCPYHLSFVMDDLLLHDSLSCLRKPFLAEPTPPPSTTGVERAE